MNTFGLHLSFHMNSKLAATCPSATSHARILLRGIYPAGDQGALHAPLEPQYKVPPSKLGVFLTKINQFRKNSLLSSVEIFPLENDRRQ